MPISPMRVKLMTERERLRPWAGQQIFFSSTSARCRRRLCLLQKREKMMRLKGCLWNEAMAIGVWRTHNEVLLTFVSS